MAGIEVLGVLASISQLLEYGLKIANCISEAYGRIEGAQSRFQRYSSQLQQLTDLARLIQQNKDLHISVVHTQIISTVTQAKSLLYTIQTATTDYTQGSCNKRYWKATRGSKETQISLGFQELEQEKSSLILCINVVQADTISVISSNVDTMNKNVATLIKSKDSQKTHESQAQLYKHSIEDKIAYLLQVENKSLVDGLDADSDGECGNDSSVVLSRNEYKFEIKRRARASNSAPRAKDSLNMEDTSSRPAKTFDHTYKNVTAFDKAPQVVGDLMSAATSHLYQDISTAGNGRQICGNVFEENSGSAGKHSYNRVESRGDGWQVVGNVKAGTKVETMINTMFS